MTSKMATENIFKEMYKAILLWTVCDSIPWKIQGTELSDCRKWATERLIPITYEEFEHLIREKLKLTSQDRIIRSTWKYLLRQKFIASKEINQYKTIHALNMYAIKEIVDIDGMYAEQFAIRTDPEKEAPESSVNDACVEG